jgi:hypothetical protein
MLSDRIRLEVRLVADLGKIRLESGHVERIIINLTTNARFWPGQDHHRDEQCAALSVRQSLRRIILLR